MIKVFIVEDHSIVRLALASLLERSGIIEVVGQSCGDHTAAAAITASNADVVIIDLNLVNGMSGIDLIRTVKADNATRRVLVFTSDSNDRQVFESLSAGAEGYALKSSRANRLIMAVRTVQSGAVWLDPMVADRILRPYIWNATTVESPRAQRAKLSAREEQVLKLVIAGLSNAQIADELNLSVETVKSHVRHILEKTHCKSRTEAAMAALKDGFAA